MYYYELVLFLRTGLVWSYLAAERKPSDFRAAFCCVVIFDNAKTVSE